MDYEEARLATLAGNYILPADQYLGSFHPDAKGRQKEREIHQKIFNNFMKDR